MRKSLFDRARTIAHAFQEGTVHYAPLRCPQCGELNDSATSVDGKGQTPSTGDVFVCLECASVLIYKETRLALAPHDYLERHPELAKEVRETQELILLSHRRPMA